MSSKHVTWEKTVGYPPFFPVLSVKIHNSFYVNRYYILNFSLRKRVLNLGM